jgi:hypothetical protein
MGLPPVDGSSAYSLTVSCVTSPAAGGGPVFIRGKKKDRLSYLLGLPVTIYGFRRRSPTPELGHFLQSCEIQIFTAHV